MRKNKSKQITIIEAGDYFDEHDIFNFKDVKEVKNIKFRLSKKKYIAVDMNLFKKIQSKAKKLHKNEESLIQEWLMEMVG